MGMTDKQFDSHIRSTLRLLEVVKKEIEADGTSTMLETMIKDFEDQLKRP